ncbi:hypothetical protein K440DRAFT_638109 [Wilcoxina mikolae CBS 423.85]|nr:hypothetical protein K440DRAFT_638109 [Wilcoxina mikolae CBS 423.85]
MHPTSSKPSSAILFPGPLDLSILDSISHHLNLPAFRTLYTSDPPPHSLPYLIQRWITTGADFMHSNNLLRVLSRLVLLPPQHQPHGLHTISTLLNTPSIFSILNRYRLKQLKTNHSKNLLFVSKTGRMNLSIPDTDRYLEMIEEEWPAEDMMQLLDTISTPFEPAVNAAASGNLMALRLFMKHDLAPLDMVLPAAVGYELGLANSFIFSDYDFVNEAPKKGGRLNVGKEKRKQGVVKEVLEYANKEYPKQMKVLLMLSELEEYDCITVLDMCSQQPADSDRAARLLKMLLLEMEEERKVLASKQCANAFETAIEQAVLLEEEGYNGRLVVVDTWIQHAADVLGIGEEDLPLRMSLAGSGQAKRVRRVMLTHDEEEGVWYLRDKPERRKEVEVEIDDALTEIDDGEMFV